MRDTPLFKVIRSFLHRRLLLPLLVLAVLTTCGLIAWRIVQLEEEHRVLSWSVDNYVSSLLVAADQDLRLFGGSSAAVDRLGEKVFLHEAPLSYHRVFLVTADSYLVFHRGLGALVTENASPPSLSLFPNRSEWPIISVPYYRSDFKSVTVATMISTPWGTVVGELDLGRVQRLIDAYLRKVPHRIIWITDRYGNLIVHPEARMVQEQENVGHEPLVARALAHPEGTRLLGSLAGTTVYGTSWRVDPWGWVVLVAYPLFPALYPVVGVAMTGFVLFFTFLGVAHWGLMRRLQAVVVGPVESLTRQVQRIAEGRDDDETSWPDFKGTFAELRVFAERFREMSRAVQEREEALLLRQKALLEVQERLERSERRYRDILESIDEAYFELDKAGIVTFHNSAFSSLLGLDPPPAHPFSLADMAHPETARAMEVFFRRIEEGRGAGELVTFEFQDTRGLSKTIEVSAQPIRNDEGSVRGIRVMARDITAKIHAERRAQELEKIVSHAQKMESLGTLASGIAHEFNNLLQAMTGYLDLLLKHTDPQDPKSRWLVRVQEAADRGAELVRRMLTFARQDEAAPEILDFNTLVRDTLSFLSRNIPRMIRLEEDLAADLPPVDGDRLQLEQILINLVVNGRDAIPEGSEGRIRVTTKKKVLPDGSEGVVLSVSDTGHGIPEPIRERIFDPFFTTKEPGKGTGLGLSTVYGIVTRHGGSITCESSVGRGTTFTITLPARALPTAKDLPAKPVEDRIVREKGAIGEKRRTVLVVDDEKNVLEFVSECLNAEGFDVLMAHSGEEALARLAEARAHVDAIILDYNMPGMGGAACFKEVRRLYPETAVVIASGYVGGLVTESLGLAENVAVLGKPYRIKDLLNILDLVLVHRNSAP